MKPRNALALAATFSPAQMRRSLVVAAVVGTILNLINQSEAFFGRDRFVIWRLLLTHCVPFLVASYGAYSALRVSAMMGDEATQPDTDCRNGQAGSREGNPLP